MSGTIDVDPAALEQHAGAVGTFMGQIEGATADAGNTIDVKAFGIACIAPAQILQQWIVGAEGFIKQAVAAGNEVSDALREMADDYRANEAQQSGSFDSLKMNLKGGS